ncbi:MAG: GxxExxY protein [Muribaculum sp.]|nr:GxxExxY protein [Muribaculum sp.]
MTDKELLMIIKEAAYQVRLLLAPGYLESVYQNALVVELRQRGIFVEKEASIEVRYKGVVVGDFRADILVEKRIIIELKAVSEIHPVHEAQLVNYLNATCLDHGVLINYGGAKYAFRVKDRIYNRPHTHYF